MRIAVTGGRDYADAETVDRVLRAAWRDSGATLVTGACPTGLDALAQAWAFEHGYEVEAFPADWSKYGRAAGPIRNRQMLETMPDLLIAFPGGAGTANAVRCAQSLGIDVATVTEPSTA